MSAHSITWPS
jgi:hypothetical protein